MRSVPLFFTPGPKYDQCPSRNFVAQFDSDTEFAIHVTLLLFSFHTMSLNIDKKMIRSLHCSSAQFISAIMFRISPTNCNLCSGKNVHKNAIGSPSIRPNSRYSEALANHEIYDLQRLCLLTVDRLGSTPAILVSRILGQQLVWYSWNLTDDELAWSESAPISSPVLQRHTFCQEILQIVGRENDFSLESLRQKVPQRVCRVFHTSRSARARQRRRLPVGCQHNSLDWAKFPRNSRPPSVLTTSGVPTKRRHQLWKVDHTTAAVGVPSCRMRTATWKFVP